MNYNNVSLYDNIINNEELSEKIFKYFDSFSYKKYNISGNDDLKFRVLKNIKDDFLKENPDFDPSEVIIEHTKLKDKKNNKKRFLQYSNSYYGMKNYINEKVIFKYNLMGLVLEGFVISEINVATGVTDNYFKIYVGSLDLTIPFNTMKTNLHVVIKNSHQMTFNMMGLLYNSNEDLIKRNQIYSENILDLERKIHKLLEEYYDYSGLFKDSLDNLYDQVKNFSGEFFNELIVLIEHVYDNYTIILNKTENEEYEIMNEIRNVTKNEYLEYINTMFELILIFKNETLQLLIGIKKEVDKIQTFQIDILYDIMDIISESLSLFKEFQEKLFKAVDKGVTNFKYDLRDYIEETIGGLLYLTDFLSINMNKNEILINAIDLDKRERVTLKLKNFRNMVLRILEILNNGILNDYEEEMSVNNKDSIKYSKEYLIKNSIEELDNNSTILIGEIKSKIHLLNHYEVYAEDIQIINEINNKSLFEFNNEISEQALNYIDQIMPNYADKNSDLIKNKNYLFSLSQNIVSTINKEIDDINEYINVYSNNYINNNNYNLDYNLYNFRNHFQDANIQQLFEEFKKIISIKLKNHLNFLISKNYYLAWDYIIDVQYELSNAPHQRLLGKIFENNYNIFKESFGKMTEEFNSGKLENFINENILHISTYILKHIKNELKTISKFYLNEKNNSNFYKLELIEEEIMKLSNNINNYFNNTSIANIQQMMSSLKSELISSISEKNISLQKLYSETYNIAEREKIYDKNCEVIQFKIHVNPVYLAGGLIGAIIFIADAKSEYVCYAESKYRNNIYKRFIGLTETKEYLNQEVNQLINNYVNKFDSYLKNYVYYSKNLYNYLNTYTDEKINNNKNIQSIFNKYKNVINNILNDNTPEKILEKNTFNNNFNTTELTRIITKLKNNIFNMDNDFYQNYYLKNKELFLEYPDEIVLKINQSLMNLKLNNEFLKNKINLSLTNKLKNIISSIKLFINNINQFNLEYILNSINKENIFDKYILNKTNSINNFFNSVYNYIQAYNSNQISNNKFILNAENYDYYINRIENNYSNFSSNLINEINEAFTEIKCIEEKPTDIDTDINSDSDILSDSNILFVDNSIFRNCSKGRYSTELNYSKYNFNVVKFRKEISNSKKFPEMIEHLIYNLNFNNIINPDKIIEIDGIVNDKNILDISIKAKNQIEKIKNDFISYNKLPDFDNFHNEFINKDGNLASDYLIFLNTFKEILNNQNLYYNISKEETYDYMTDNIDKLLDEFNSTIFNFIINTIEQYDYFSLDYMNLFNSYNKKIENSFYNYEQNIRNMKTNNNFYSIAKKIFNEIILKKIKNIEEKIKQYSNNYNFESIGFKFNFEKEFDLELINLYMNYEFNYVYDYYELIENNKNIYIDRLLEDIKYIKFKQDKFKSIITNFNNYIRIIKNYVTVGFIEKIDYNKSLCLNTLSDLYSNISEDLNKNNITETDDYILSNCTIEEIVNALFNISYDDTCLNISEINSTFYLNQFKFLFYDCTKNNFYNYSYIILDRFGEQTKKKLDSIIANITNIITSNIINENYLSNFLMNYYKEEMNLEIDMNKYNQSFKAFESNIQDINSKEPEKYKNYIREFLIESFSISCSNKIKLFISNEIVNTMNILISDKINIFIEYFLDKLKNDFEYYSFLLNQMEELGNSSKSSIINLFSNIPKKLNESIYTFIEDEIFYYIDIFFRENKNIFINNFI